MLGFLSYLGCIKSKYTAKNMKFFSRAALSLAAFCACLSAKAQTASELRQWFEAQNYEKISEYAQTNPEGLTDSAYFWIGRSYVRLYEDQTAVAFLNRATQKNPKFADAHFYKAVSLVAMGQTEAGIASVDEAIKNDPKKGLYYSFRADLHRNAKQIPQAIKVYTTALQFADCPLQASEHLINLYAEQKNYKKALEIQRRQIATADRESLIGRQLYTTEELNYLLYNTALNEYKIKDYKNAEKTLLRLRELQPEKHQTTVKLIQVYYASKQYAKAEPLEALIQKARTEQKLSKSMVESYCFDQFDVKGKEVHAHRNFVSDSSRQHSVYSFHVLDTLGEVEYYLHIEQNESAKKLGQRYLYVKSYSKKEAIYLYAEQKLPTPLPAYPEIRATATKIIADKVKHSHERYILE